MSSLRIAGRGLSRNPAFTAMAVAVLALGLGATTALVSLGDAILWQPMPYPESDRLMTVYESFPERGFPQLGISLPTFRDLARRSRSFSAMAAENSLNTLVLTGRDAPLRLAATYVTPGYFELLGARPMLGRTFTLEEDRVPDGHPVVILSHGLWQRAFAGEPAIVGRGITLGERVYTVVGILEEGFVDLPSLIRPTDLWVPAMMLDASLQPSGVDNRSSRVLHAVGRLAPGVSPEQARLEIADLARAIAAEHPETSQGYSGTAAPLGDEQLGALRKPVKALMAGAAFLLVIGILNVGSLLLARGVARARELGLRQALGARRRDLFALLFSEGLLIALAAWALGLQVAWMSVELIARASPVPTPGFLRFQPSLTAALLTLAVALAAAVAFAIAAALPTLRGRGTRGGLMASAGRAGRGGSGRGGIRRALVVTEVAVAVVLMVGAALVTQGLAGLRGMEVGFETRGVLTLRLDLLSRRYESEAEQSRFARELLGRLGSLPGVGAVDIWSPSIPGTARWLTQIEPEAGESSTGEGGIIVVRNHVTPGALERLGIEITQGRGIGSQDRDGDQLVAVLSESAAEALWPGGEPLGKRLRRSATGGSTGQDIRWYTVVGVAETVRLQDRLREQANDMAIYFAFFQRPRIDLNLFLFGAGASDVRQAVEALDPDLPVTDLESLASLFRQQEAAPRFTAFLLGLFAAFALVLSMLGLYGLLSYLAHHRRREIAVRSALGADRLSLLGLFGVETGGLVGAGLGIGLIAAAGLTHLLGSLLYGVDPRAPEPYWIAACALAVAALLAALPPAWRASRTDPAAALRAQDS